VTDNLNPVGRVYYSFSTFLCVPNALPELAALLGVAGLTVGAVAASDLLSGATLATAWAAEAAVLAWLSPRLRDARLTLASIVFLTAAAVRALAVDAPLTQAFSDRVQPHKPVRTAERR
jgi:hypothetical protein